MARAVVQVPPRWTISDVPGPSDADPRLLITSGPGFGDGRHDTTHLCLQAIAALCPRTGDVRMLDFGSGSGILSIAGARMGARVDAVEIDPSAVDHAERNVAANGLSARIRHVSLEEATGPYELCVANILRAVLLDHAESLVARMATGGTLILSGLVSTDTPQLASRYMRLLGDARPEIYERGEWRALVWRRCAL